MKYSITALAAFAFCSFLIIPIGNTQAQNQTPFNINDSTAGNVGIGTTTPTSQLHLNGHTVRTGINWSSVTGGNHNFEIQGTLDATNATSDVAGVLMSWNTLGNNANVDGMMLRLKPGYGGGTHSSRVADFQNLIAGKATFNALDISGTIGSAAESQGTSAGDNIGAYNIAGYAHGINLGEFGRSTQDYSEAKSGITAKNFGVAGLGGHFHDYAAIAVGGYFGIQHYADFAANMRSTRSGALIADVGDYNADIIIGKTQNSGAWGTTDVFRVDKLGNVIAPSFKLPTGDSLHFLRADGSTALVSSFINDKLVSHSDAGMASPAMKDFWDSKVSLSGTETLNNKRISQRVTTTSSSATPEPDSDKSDMYTVTALAAAATFSAPVGTPTDGQVLIIRIKDNGTARILGWNAAYRAGTDFALPTTTVISKTMYLQLIYNAADSKWDAVRLSQGY